MSLGTPQFRANRCTRYRFRYSQCARCSVACPHDAIALDEEGARLDPARCQGCGLCTAACHTAAWESESFQPIELLRQAIRQPAWSLACAPSGAKADAVVPCLGAVHGVMLAYLARRGIVLTLRGAWHCDTCAHGAKGAAQLAANLDALHTLHASARAETDPDWRMPVVEAPTPSESQHGPVRRGSGFDASRRQLFRRIAHRASAEVAEASGTPKPQPVPARAIRAGPYFVPEQRDLLQIVCKRADDLPTRVPLHDMLPLMQLTLHSGCTLCEACFRACPTGALQIGESPDDWALTFQTDRCVGCQVCLEVCQPRVLDAQPRIDVRPERAPIRLLAMPKQRCTRCDRHFVAPSPRANCTVCTDDEDAFSAIYG